MKGGDEAIQERSRKTTAAVTLPGLHLEYIFNGSVENREHASRLSNWASVQEYSYAALYDSDYDVFSNKVQPFCIFIELSQVPNITSEGVYTSQ